MKNITLSADDDLIEKARLIAQKQNISLNQLFRHWLRQLTGVENGADDFEALMSKLDYAKAGHRFTRDEMNAR